MKNGVDGAVLFKFITVFRHYRLLTFTTSVRIIDHFLRFFVFFFAQVGKFVYLCAPNVRA